MPSLNTQIARGLIGLDREAQREAFACILAFLREQTGEDVPSLHDFISGTAAPELTADTRAHLLGRIAGALRSGEMSELQTPTT